MDTTHVFERKPPVRGAFSRPITVQVRVINVRLTRDGITRVGMRGKKKKRYDPSSNLSSLLTDLWEPRLNYPTSVGGGGHFHVRPRERHRLGIGVRFQDNEICLEPKRQFRVPRTYIMYFLL